jgi:hypothetical protein
MSEIEQDKQVDMSDTEQEHQVSMGEAVSFKAGPCVIGNGMAMKMVSPSCLPT